MTAPFEALQARLNRAVFARLASADATLNGVAVSAIFDNAYTAQTVGAYGMASAQPTLTLQSAAAGAAPQGLTAVVGGVSYQVTHHEPDGTGLTRLYLERA